MFCDCGSKKSFVVNTRNHENAIRRHRKCTGCNKNFFTVEIKELASIPPAVEPLPDKRGLYTEKAAATLKMKKAEVRRKNEDRVSNYFIEDEYEDDL